jgi:hypothetical protein
MMEGERVRSGTTAEPELLVRASTAPAPRRPGKLTNPGCLRRM